MSFLDASKLATAASSTGQQQQAPLTTQAHCATLLVRKKRKRAHNEESTQRKITQRKSAHNKAMYTLGRVDKTLVCCMAFVKAAFANEVQSTVDTGVPGLFRGGKALLGRNAVPLAEKLALLSDSNRLL
jgi:hypothetical protein